MLDIEQRRTLLFASKTVLFATAIFYFCYHLSSGRASIPAMMQLRQQLDTTRTLMEEKHQERETLQQRVNMLYDHSLDIDLLEEQARKIIGYSAEGEVVLFRGDEDTLSED